MGRYFDNINILRENSQVEAKKRVDERKAALKKAEREAAKAKKEKSEPLKKLKGKKMRDVKQETDHIVFREIIHDNILQDFGTRLRKYREGMGLTQEEMIEKFAPFLPKTTGKYSGWENGKPAPSIEFLVYLHEVEGVDLNCLLCGDEQPIDHAEELKKILHHGLTLLSQSGK